MKYKIRNKSGSYIGTMSRNIFGEYIPYRERYAKVWKTKKSVEKALEKINRTQSNEYFIEEYNEDI